VRVWDLESEGHATLRIELQRQALSVASTADGLVIGTTASFYGSIFVAAGAKVRVTTSGRKWSPSCSATSSRNRWFVGLWSAT
jgi:hypothetical protein